MIVMQSKFENHWVLTTLSVSFGLDLCDSAALFPSLSMFNLSLSFYMLE